MNIERALASAAAYLPYAPASAEVMRELEHSLGIPLPTDYLVFLARFRGFAGPNPLIYDCTTAASDLLSFYHSVALAGEPAAPEGCIMFGFGGGKVPECYIQGGVDGEAVYWGEDWGNYGQIADAFRTFIERQVFLRTYFPSSYIPCITDFVATSSSNNCVSILGPLLQSQGMNVEKFSDRFALCCTFATGCLIVEQWEKQPCWIHLKSESVDDLNRIKALVTSVIKVTSSPVQK